MYSILFRWSAISIFVFIYSASCLAFDGSKGISDDKKTLPPTYASPSQYNPASKDATTRTYKIGPQGSMGVTETKAGMPTTPVPATMPGERTQDITFTYKEGKPVEIEYKSKDANLPAVAIENVMPKVEVKVEVEKVGHKEESTALKEGTITITEEMKKVKETEETNALVSPAAKEKPKVGEEEKTEATFVEGGIGVKEVAPDEKKDLIEKETGKRLKESKIQQKQYVNRVLGYAVAEEDVPWEVVRDMLYREEETKTEPEQEEFLSVPVDAIIRGEIQSITKMQSKAAALKSEEGVLYTLVGEAEEMLRGKEGGRAKITGRRSPDLNYKGKKIKVIEIIGVEEIE